LWRNGDDAPASAEASDPTARAPQPKEQPGAAFPPRGWKIEELQAIEELLAFHVGPMAKLLMKQSAKTATDGLMLVSLLAKHIPAGPTRKAFIAAALDKVPESVEPEATPERPMVHLSGNLIGPGEIEKAASLLAPYLGPIAKVIARKTLGRTSDPRIYYRQLAGNLKPGDRARFLKDAGYGP
jgi:serine/threonine-protein kinase